MSKGTASRALLPQVGIMKRNLEMYRQIREVLLTIIINELSND